MTPIFDQNLLAVVFTLGSLLYRYSLLVVLLSSVDAEKTSKKLAVIPSGHIWIKLALEILRICFVLSDNILIYVKTLQYVGVGSLNWSMKVRNQIKIVLFAVPCMSSVYHSNFTNVPLRDYCSLYDCSHRLILQIQLINFSKTIIMSSYFLNYDRQLRTNCCLLEMMLVPIFWNICNFNFLPPL